MAGKVLVEAITVASYRVNTYIVACPHTRAGVIIDPGGEAQRLLNHVDRLALNITHILNTHGHADHVGANATLQNTLHAPVCMHRADALFFADDINRQRMASDPGPAPPGAADILLEDREILPLGNTSIEVIHTPGHTPGSVCYRIEDLLFTGDTLFVGAVGRTDLRGGSLPNLLESLARNIITLPPQTKVYPGHDYGDTPTSTISREMKQNPYITDFILP